MRRDQVSLQLYTLREHTARDMAATLQAVAAMGYPAVEFAGYGGLSPRELRSVLDEHGLRASGVHVPLDAWEADPAAALADLQTIGCAHAVVPMAPEERRRDEESVKKLAESFNHWGELCRSRGMTFSYHNHNFEFAPLGGSETTMWEVLLRETDPEVVSLELDLYWAQYARVDPETLLRDNASRISLVHLKDMASDEERSDAPVGEGTLPWPDLLRAAEDAGAEWYIVEQDHPKDPLEDVQSSLRNLESMADG